MCKPDTVRVNIYGPALAISILNNYQTPLHEFTIFPPTDNQTDEEQAITDLLATLIDQMEHCLIEHMRLCPGCHEPKEHCVCELLAEEEWAWNRQLARIILAKGLVE